MRLLILSLSLMLVYFQYNFWFNQNGWRDYQQKQIELAQLEQENKRLTLRNQALQAEVSDLKQTFNALEERARKERNMVKGNEVFYRIVPNNQ